MNWEYIKILIWNSKLYCQDQIHVCMYGSAKDKSLESLVLLTKSMKIPKTLNVPEIHATVYTDSSIFKTLTIIYYNI
jgi:hypothetical protein